MVAQSICPDPKVIRDLLHGDVPESEFDDLAMHFDGCGDCRDLFEIEAVSAEFLGDTSRLGVKQNRGGETEALERLVRDLPMHLSSISETARNADWSTESVIDMLEPSNNPENIGRLGSHEIVEVIGRGGMGIVLRGIDEKLNRVVAIKVLAPEFAAQPNARNRFFREAKAAAAVSHDHVITIHAVDDCERLPYLVMEYIKGESLEDCVRRTGPQSLESILRIGRQMALGLAAAHEVGLVHRDMKPANILLENGIQRVRITDFGLARAVDDVAITQTGVVSRTPIYMSPEQANGELVDHRSDLFSLGSILYTMCTGRPAFRASSTVAVLKRVCEDMPRPIREINPDIPDWLVDIVDRLMAKQADDRFQTADEVAELLGVHLAHYQDPQNVAAPMPIAAVAGASVQTRSRFRWVLLLILIGVVSITTTEAVGYTKLVEYFGIILKLETDNGTLVVDIQDENVKVSVDGDEVVIDGVGVQEIRLKPGKHHYTTTRNGVAASKQWVTIERGGKVVVRVKQLPPQTESMVGSPVSNPRKHPPPMIERGVPFVETGNAARTANYDSKITVKAGTRIGEPETVILHGPEETRQPSYDGIVFPLPHQIRRLKRNVLIHGPLGDHRVPYVSSQLWGQRCTSAIRNGGLLHFNVHRRFHHDKPQRVWLLVCDADWSKTGDHGDLKFDTPRSLIATGWQHVDNTITYRASDREGKNAFTWSTFYRDVKPGEWYKIRTNSRRTPLLVWGSVDMDGLVVDTQWDQKIEMFEDGASISLGNGNHIFDRVPEFLLGRLYTKRNGYEGIARFSVIRSQRVTIALYDWRHIDDGNSSGNWRQELTSRKQLADQGWVDVAKVKALHSNPKFGHGTWYFYSRDCKSGETFAIRNHKYQAPIIFSEKSATLYTAPAKPRINRNAAGQRGPLKPDGIPSAAIMIRNQPANAEFIQLDASKVATIVSVASDKPGVHAIGGPNVTIQNFPVFFQGIARGAYQQGHTFLVGQIAGPIMPEEQFKVTRFQRTGKHIRIEFAQDKTAPLEISDVEVANGEQPRVSLYFQVKLPPLPSGNYEVDAILRKTTIKGRLDVSAKDNMARALRLLAVEAMKIKPTSEILNAGTQKPTGLDLTEIMAASKQHADVKGFPTDHAKWQSYCAKLGSDRKMWALCAVLNFDGTKYTDARIFAARQLAKLADPNTVPILLAAAKQNNFFVSGSESATLHAIYRVTLKKALSAATGLELTPLGIKLGTVRENKPVTITSDDYPEMFGEYIAFDRVEAWLRIVYLTDSN